MNAKVILTLGVFVLVLTSCTKFDYSIEGVEHTYFSKFTHNAIEYTYTSSKISTSSNGGKFTTVSEFYKGEYVDFTLLIAFELNNTSEVEVMSLFSDVLNSSLNLDDCSPQTVVFIPKFHKSDNGGLIELDGQEFVYTKVLNTSPFYFDGEGNCFDVEIEFDAFANTGSVHCGVGTEEEISCINMFTEGLVRTKICI